jgi:hypothetical protein
MPTINLPWNEVAQTGNPTRSPQMARLIKNMKKFQVRRQGVVSKARRALTLPEMERIMTHYWHHPNKLMGLCFAAALSVQFSMIARSDDIGKFREGDLGPYEAFPLFAIICRIAWSKNVVEERDAPNQVLIGAMDPKYCTLLSLGIMWMEACLAVDQVPNEFVFKINSLDCPIRIKETIQRGFKEAVNDPLFLMDKPGPIGTHSVRKAAATYARGNGCTKVRVFYLFAICFQHLN